MDNAAALIGDGEALEFDAVDTAQRDLDLVQHLWLSYKSENGGFVGG